MTKVVAEWDRQLVSQKLPRSTLDAVRTYEAQLKPDRTYGVYILCSPNEVGGGEPPYEAFVHVNHAFPRSSKPVLRMTWNRLAPRYEWAADPAAEHARVFTGLVIGGLGLTKGPLKSAEMKMHLFNHADRTFGRWFAGNLTGFSLPFNVTVQGNWLHLGWV